MLFVVRTSCHAKIEALRPGGTPDQPAGDDSSCIPFTQTCTLSQQRGWNVFSKAEKLHDDQHICVLDVTLAQQLMDAFNWKC
jgi:hypothetical protein